MQLINTRFFVTKELTRRVFWQMAKSWWATSDFYDFPESDFDFQQEEYYMASSDNKQTVHISHYDTCFILQLSTESEQDRYETSFVLDDVSEQYSIQVVQEHVLLSASTENKRPRTHLPNLMKDIFWSEYGDFDGKFLTNNRPYIFGKADAKWLADFLNGKTAGLNPIVYVSVSSSQGLPLVDCNKLAHELMGQAHVVVEGSPHVARMMRDLTNGENPYDGRIGVYLPSGEHTVFSIRDDDATAFVYFVVNNVRKMLAGVSVPDEYNIVRIRQQHLFSKLADKEDAELVQLCESMIQDKDAEIAELKRKLKEANLKAESLQASFDRNKQESDEQDSVKFVISGEELYEGEMFDVILRILKREYDSMTGDDRLSSSRKYDVLGVLLAHNFFHRTDDELESAIRKAFDDGVVTREGVGCLRNAGFVVERQSNNHYAVWPDGFEKYKTTFASTPSDKSSGFRNGISDFFNRLYGY